MTKEYVLWKGLLFRFLRGFVSGIIAAGFTFTGFVGVQTWADFKMALSMLLLMCLIGGMTGSFMALDKYIRSLPVEE
jgi:hypothetical protein